MNTITKIDIIDANILAKEILNENGNDIAAALPVLMSRGESDGMIYRSIMRPLYRTACYELLSRQIRAERGRIWTPQPAITGRSNTRAKEASVKMLLDFPLPGGLPLRFATKIEVEKAARFYRAQSGDMLSKYRWLDLIAKSIDANKKVSDVFSEEKLRALQEEASK